MQKQYFQYEFLKTSDCVQKQHLICIKTSTVWYLNPHEASKEKASLFNP